MAKLIEITKFLDKELKIKSIQDSSKNGLQVRCKNEVKKAGFAVDASLSTFELAKKANIDLLIVHHSLKWKPQKHREVYKKRLGFLEKNKISLYGVHLPLDSNEKYGNNIELCRILDLIEIKKFALYKGSKIGYSGKFKKSTNLEKISGILNKKLKTKCKFYSFGKKTIKSIGIVSGGGGDHIDDAFNEKLDCFLVGEIDLGDYNRAKDFKLSIILAGHYATETLGVKALMPIISKRFKVKTVFIDNTTGI